jgi:anti-anti-sigma factor
MSRKKLEVASEARDDQTWIYTLSGSLFGSKEGYALQEEVQQKIASGVRKIVIDLASVESIDSSGVGILVAMMWSVSQGGAGLILASISDRVEKVLSLAMLLDHIDHADTVHNALARLDHMKLETKSG